MKKRFVRKVSFQFERTCYKLSVCCESCDQLSSDLK